MSLVVRRAAAEDCQAVCEMLEELHLIHSCALPGVFRKPDASAMFRDRVEELVHEPDSAVFVAEVDGEVAGAALAVVRDSPDRMAMMPRRYGWVESIGVRERFRREGVGSALMHAAERWSRENGASTCELNVWEFNQAAIRFYESLGFETASRRMWRKLG